MNFDELAYFFSAELSTVTPADLEWETWLGAVTNIVSSAAGFHPDLLDTLYDEYLAGRTSRQAAVDVLIGGLAGED